METIRGPQTDVKYFWFIGLHLFDNLGPHAGKQAGELLPHGFVALVVLVVVVGHEFFKVGPEIRPILKEADYMVGDLALPKCKWELTVEGQTILDLFNLDF